MRAEKGLSPTRPSKKKKKKKEEPKLNPLYDWIWDGYFVLSSQRTSNEIGPQPIPVSEVVAYINLIGGSNRNLDFGLFMACVIAMDRVLFEHIEKERKAKAQREKAKNKAKQSRKGE